MTYGLPQNIHNAINRHWVGADRFLEEMMEAANNMREGGYPPYNLIKQEDDVFMIELALAGFTREDITISVKDRVLIIESDKEIADRPGEYMHHGIAARSFKRVFKLAEFIEVQDANMADGILTITLNRVVPDTHKPRTIDIK